MRVSRTSYASTSADEAWDALSRMYTRARPHATSSDAVIRFDTAATRDVAVDHGWLHTAGGAFDPSPDQLNIITVLHGRIDLDFDRHGQVGNTTDDSYVYLPERRADLRWQDFGALAVRLPMSLVVDTMVELTGLARSELRFVSPRPLSAAHGHLWRHTALALWHDLISSAESDDAMGSLEHQALLNVTASAAVTAFPSTATTRGYLRGPGDVRPAAIRRAVAYVDSHASLPITVTDIAEAAGTSPRAIQAAFRRHLQTSPAGYLRRVRMEAAHRDLQTADPSAGVTVESIARRWGFGPRSRFGSTYLARFSVTPEHTLHT